MRIGLVCPYTWNVPGGVQAHVRDLAETLLGLGHDVSVLTPADEDAVLPPYAEAAGRAVPIPYNGSVARLLLGPVSAGRVRRWLREGGFEVLHVHEPIAPSITLLACYFATGPIVATFHSSNARSKMLSAFEPALIPALEKIQGKIAVSPAARETVVRHLGGDPALIPNGVSVAQFADATPLPGHAPGERPGPTVGFLGRLDEPRKGLEVLLAAFPLLAERRPDVRMLVAGPGDADAARAQLPGSLRERVSFLGLVSEADKARLYRSVNAFCAPNTGGESFGIVLLEAMAAGTPVVASDLEAFRRVLGDGRAGRLFPVGDVGRLATTLDGLLGDPAAARELVAAGREVVKPYDWPVVARAVVGVYETVAGGAVVAVDQATAGADDPSDDPAPDVAPRESPVPPT